MQCEAVWCCAVQCGAVHCGMVQYGMYGMIYHFMLCFFIFTGGSRVDQNSLKDRNRLLVVSNFVS